MSDPSNLITEIAAGVKALKDDILPPIARDARSASVLSIQLEAHSKSINTRIVNLESERSDRDQKINDNGRSITATEKEVAGLTKWRTYIATILIPLSLAALGFAGKAVSDSATCETTITSEIQYHHKITDRQQKEINSLAATHKEDQRILIRRIDHLPRKMKSIIVKNNRTTNFTDVYLNLSKKSQRQFKALLEEADVAIMY